jgi:hypothetical protein
MGDYIAGVVTGLFLFALLSIGVSAWMFRHLTAADPNETIVIEGEVYEGDK